VSLGVVTANPNPLPILVPTDNHPSTTGDHICVQSSATWHYYNDERARITLLGPSDATHAIHLTKADQ
jgi:hypothetical protein